MNFTGQLQKQTEKKRPLASSVRLLNIYTFKKDVWFSTFHASLPTKISFALQPGKLHSQKKLPANITLHSLVVLPPHFHPFYALSTQILADTEPEAKIQTTARREKN